MTKYLVKVTSSALKDMETIYKYIAYELGAPQAAGNTYDKIAEEILKLENFPERNKVLNYQFSTNVQLRQIVIGNYLVLYYIENSSVIVLAVLYGRCDIEEKLNSKYSR